MSEGLASHCYSKCAQHAYVRRCMTLSGKAQNAVQTSVVPERSGPATACTCLLVVQAAEHSLELLSGLTSQASCA